MDALNVSNKNHFVVLYYENIYSIPFIHKDMLISIGLKTLDFGYSKLNRKIRKP